MTHILTHYDFDVLYYMNPDEALASNPELFKENVKQALIFCHYCNEEKNLTPENNQTLLLNFRFIPNHKCRVYRSNGSQCLTKECCDLQEEVKALKRADERFWKQVDYMEARCDMADKRANDAFKRAMAMDSKPNL